MRHYVFIMADTNVSSMHCGYCKDIKKAINFYSEMPTLLYPPEKQNVLYFLEEHNGEAAAIERVDEIYQLTNEEKINLILQLNPEWVELNPIVKIQAPPEKQKEVMKFTELLKETHIGLTSMKPGTLVEIDRTKIYKQYGKETMIDVCKEWIDQNPDYELSNDYKFIKRLNKF
jgi:putative endonuclease